MYCSNCGAWIEGAVKFCPNCAALIEKNETPPEISSETPPQKPPKKKLGTKKIVFIAAALIIAVLVLVFGIFLVKYLKAADSGEKNTQIEFVEAEGEVEEAKEATNPSTSLEDMLFVINGVEYQFPLKIDDFTSNGWKMNSDDIAETVVEAQKTHYFSLTCGDSRISVGVFNPTEKKQKVIDCYIGEISVKWADVVLAKNITPHKSTRKEIKEAYGMPNSTSSHVYWRYGEFSKNTFLTYDSQNAETIVTLKFHDDCSKNGSKDGDLLMFVKIQWYDPDVQKKYAERSGE